MTYQTVQAIGILTVLAGGLLYTIGIGVFLTSSNYERAKIANTPPFPSAVDVAATAASGHGSYRDPWRGTIATNLSESGKSYWFRPGWYADDVTLNASHSSIIGSRGTYLLGSVKTKDDRNYIDYDIKHRYMK
jgi:hypothetical protein